MVEQIFDHIIIIIINYIEKSARSYVGFEKCARDVKTSVSHCAGAINRAASIHDSMHIHGKPSADKETRNRNPIQSCIRRS